MNNNQNQNQPDRNRKQKQNKPQMPSYRRGPLGWLLIAVIIFITMMMIQQWQGVEEIRWDQFEEYVEGGKVKSVTISENEIKGKFTQEAVNSREKGAPEIFKVNYNKEWIKTSDINLKQWMKKYNVKVTFEPESIWLIMLLQWVLPLLLLIGFFYFIFARNLRKGAGGMLMSFGKSKHRLQAKDRVKVTFRDVAGVDEAKEEVAEIIEFLKNPQKFQRLGGRIPRGVLLVGPPGCGKTLLAKAIAGEADVPYFSISGSDFVEMFVGVGASRVRDLFKQAKQNSPCIIFLDEVDAIGRKRGAGFVGGGHDEREQTLNAILVEMDGFDTNDQVIVIAATNRADILDHALTRPGRFDRQINVPLPDLKGRAEILKVHARNIKLGPNAELERLARGTPMFTGADLAAIINEAALMATMAEKDYVEMADLEEARDKVRWGRARRSRVMDRAEKKLTAYHEAGHTLVQCLLEEADPLHKVSIIPRGPMGGATFALPEKDRTFFTKRYLMALLKVCFGGRIAEEMFCDDISSGAQSDITQATKIAKQMVLTWGMSEQLGLIRYGPDQGVKEQTYSLPGEKEYSEKTAEMIDREIKNLITQAYKDAKQLIEANKDRLQKIAEALLKYETLDAKDVETIIKGGTLEKTTVSDLLIAEKEKESAAEEQNKQKPQAAPEKQSSEKHQSAAGGPEKT